MNNNKFYASQQERVQDEMMQAKADALRKGLLGGQMASMMFNKGDANAQPSNPLMSKLFGGAMNAAKTAKNNPLASMTAGAGGMFGGSNGF